MARAKKRRVRGLKRAELLEERPPFIPEPKPKRASAQAGLRYEAKVARYLKRRYGEDRVWHGPWFEFEDDQGVAWCSPDILIFPEDDEQPIVVADCKLTVTKSGPPKLRGLYVPVAKMVWPQKKIRPLMIAHNLKLNWPDPLISRWDDIYREDDKWVCPTLNWRG